MPNTILGNFSASYVSCAGLGFYGPKASGLFTVAMLILFAAASIWQIPRVAAVSNPTIDTDPSNGISYTASIAGCNGQPGQPAGGYSDGVVIGANYLGSVFRAFVKFSLAGVSGTLTGATLSLYLHGHSNWPNYEVGMGNVQVIHISDYGRALDAATFYSTSIGNDPGVLISSATLSGLSAVPAGWFSIDVTAAMQDDINNARAYSTFMVKMSAEVSSCQGSGASPSLEFFGRVVASPINGIPPNTWPYIQYSLSTTVTTAVGTVSFATSGGAFSGLSGAAVSSVPVPPPAGVQLPDGIFYITISGLTAGATVTVTITLSSPFPSGTFSYWKFHGGTWTQMPTAKASLDSTRTVITLTLTDGATPDDADGLANGVIVDPGGPGIPGAPHAIFVGGNMLPVNLLPVLAPWIAAMLALTVVAVETLLVRREKDRHGRRI